MKRRLRCSIPESFPGSINIGQYLADRFSYYDLGKWEEEIVKGRIRINQNTAIASDHLSAGDSIEYSCPPLPEPVVNNRYRILHEDSHLLVVDKPANLPCHPRGRYFHNTLWAQLKKDLDNGYFFFINRIDRETSGLVLVAKNKKSAAICQRQFKHREVGKKYFAIVRGCFPEHLEAAGCLIRDQLSVVRHKQRFENKKEFPDDRMKKEARTQFRRMHFFDGLSLIEAIPISGRLHQIRATLEFLKYPLVGDKLYGGDEGMFLRFTADKLSVADKKKLLLLRQALHAAEIQMHHPQSGRPVRFKSPLPADFLQLMGRNLSPLLTTTGKADCKLTDWQNFKS